MIIWLIIFFVSLLLGQLGAVSVLPGVTLYVHDIILFLILSFYIVRHPRKWTTPVLLIPILTFVGIGALTLLLNVYRFTWTVIGISSLYLIRFAFYSCLYFILVESAVTPAFLLWGLYGFGSAFSVLGLVQYFLYPDLRNLTYLGWDPHYYRLFSTFLDPNFAGIVIVLTLFLGFYLMVKEKRMWLTLLQIVSGVALFLTYSRSSYLAFAMGVILWIIWKKKWLAGFIIALVIGFLISLPTPGGKTLRLTRTDSTVARLGNWQEAFGLISKSPLIGYGFNTLPRVQNAKPTLTSQPSHAASGIDSSILFLLATTGLIGFISFGWIVWRVSAFFLRNFGQSDMSLLYWCIVLAVGIHSLFNNSLFYAWVMIWLWIFIASSEKLTIPEKRK